MRIFRSPSTGRLDRKDKSEGCEKRYFSAYRHAHFLPLLRGVHKQAHGFPYFLRHGDRCSFKQLLRHSRTQNRVRSRRYMNRWIGHVIIGQKLKTEYSILCLLLKSGVSVTRRQCLMAPMSLLEAEVCPFPNASVSPP